MDKPLISYVVTTYNIEQYVEESVRCAFSQTYSPLEIVLSDDCSTDHTFDIMQKMAKEYKGPHKIILNRNESNLGITKHMNKVYLELATGEIIVAAHGDDKSEPDRVSIVQEYFEKHPNCTQVAVSATAVNENLQPLSDYVQKNCMVTEEHIYHFGSGAHVSVGFSAFRKSVMEYFGPLANSCPTEDDPIGFRAILMGEIAFLPDKMILYRKHSGSNSNPKLFEKFPLDEIYNQNIRDMKIALANKLITQKQFDEEQKRLYYSKEKRKVYRQYFANRTFKSFYNIVTYQGLSFRQRLSYIREHFEYLIGHHE